MNDLKRWSVAFGVGVAVLAGTVPAAYAEIRVSPYVWFEGLDGDGRVLDTLWAADADPFDLDHYDGGAAVTVEAVGERWAFLGSFASIDVAQETVDVGTPSGVGEVEASQTLIDGLVGYRLTRGGLYVVAGARSLDYDVDLLSPVARSDSSDWLDPVVGLWYRADAPKWGVSIEGDLAVGGDSDDSYNIQSLIFWHFSHNVSLTLGYRALDAHFEDEGAGFRWRVVSKGPLAGLAFSF